MAQATVSRSSITRKYIVAVTGVLLFGFLVGHLLGNLQVFGGRYMINEYAEHLRGFGWLLWVARGGLIVIALLHIYYTILLATENAAARGDVGYQYPRYYQKASWASRFMILSGLVVLVFLIFHLLHFTFQVIDPEYAYFYDDQQKHDVYRMLITGFSKPAIVAFYVVSMGLLFFHLTHGMSSIFQTLGLNFPAWTKYTFRIGPAVSLVITFGFAAIPLGVYFGASYGVVYPIEPEKGEIEIQAERVQRILEVKTPKATSPETSTQLNTAAPETTTSKK